MGTENLTDVKSSIEERTDLPVISVVIAKILELCGDEEVNLSEISEVVKKDIALSSKILKIVNSSFYGFSKKISTISQALVILGLESVKNLSMSLSVVDAFSNRDQEFDYKSFWIASFYSATSARLISKYTHYKNTEEVFVAGLIHDLGVVLLGSYYPESYGGLIKAGGSGVQGSIKAEERVFNTNHTEVGEILGVKWNLPDKLTNVIRFHHSIDLWDIFPEEQKLLLKIVYISDIFTRVCLEKGAVGKNIVNLNMEAKRVLKLEEKQVEEIFEKTNEELEESIKYFSLDISSPRKSYTEIISDANRELAHINLSYEKVMLNIYNRNVVIDQGAKLARERQLEVLAGNDPGAFKGMVGQSVEMLKLFATIKQVSKYSSTILINGETGTGKELVASAIHELSPRKRRKYVAFNIASIAPNLIESELFGHEKGAFTGADSRKTGLFEAADKGTVFIDEIGELPMPMQVSLLRVLESRKIRRVGGINAVPVDVRILAATNRDLMSEVDSGNFREDLFYRLNVVNIRLLCLKERREDIIPLCHYYLKKLNFKFQKNVRISEKVMDLLLRYPWRGNVRELVNVLESAVVQAPEDFITIDSLPPSFRDLAASTEGEALETGFETLEQVEKEHISRILKMLKGNKARAAKVLGLGRSSLYRKIEKYRLDEYL